MGKEYRAKVFRSGNSVALRLPKALGLKEGDEMILREERAEFVFKPAEEPKKKIDVSRFWGKAPGARLVPHGDFDERPSTIARREAQKSR
jgi:antitoxin VapB